MDKLSEVESMVLRRLATGDYICEYVPNTMMTIRLLMQCHSEGVGQGRFLAEALP